MDFEDNIGNEDLEEITSEEIFGSAGGTVPPDEDDLVSAILPTTGAYSDLLLADHELIAAIVEVSYTAWADALNELDANCYPTHLAVRANQLQVQKIAPRLMLLGFTQEISNGQIRFVNLTRYPHPVRIVFAKGTKKFNNYKVADKGNESRTLIEIENSKWSYQNALDLFDSSEEDDTIEDRQNYFLLSEIYVSPLYGAHLTLHLTLPTDITASGRRISSDDNRILFNGSLTSPEPSIEDLSQGQGSHFEILDTHNTEFENE